METGDVGPEMAAPLEDALARLGAVKTMRPPNQPITGYSPPNPALLDSFIGRLERAGRKLLAYEASAIRDMLPLPALEGDPPIQEHLAVYEQIAELRSALQTLCDKAVVAGYGRLDALPVPKTEVVEELKVLSATVAALSEEVKRLNRRDFGGVALSLGFLSVDLKSMQAALHRLSSAIRGERNEVDAAEIWSVGMELSRIAIGLQVRADGMGTALNDKLDQWVRNVVEATRMLMDVARAILQKALARRQDADEAKGASTAAVLRKIPRFDIAVDLGTSVTRVWMRGKGIVLTEASVVALRNLGGRMIVHAAGADAAEMVGKTPGHMQTIFPLHGGVIGDFEVGEAMLRLFLKRVNNGRRVASGRLLVTVQTAGAEVHHRAVTDLCQGAGSPKAVLIERSIAAAVGAQAPIARTEPTLLVSIGGGATEICVFANSRLLRARVLSRGGQDIDEEIMALLRADCDLLISDPTAERIKLEVSRGEPFEMLQVRGRDMRRGVPTSIAFPASRFLGQFYTVRSIAESVKETLDSIRPEIRSAIDRVHLVGGGALFPPIRAAIAEATSLDVVLAAEPAEATIKGCGAFMEGRGSIEAWTARDGG